jgi:hypothetical protein
MRAPDASRPGCEKFGGVEIHDTIRKSCHHGCDIKINYSWFLAGVSVLWGMWLCHGIPEFQAALLRVHGPVPFMTRTVVAVGPIGWLVLSAAFAVLVILKDRKFRSRYWNPLLTIFLMISAGGVMYALIYPFLQFGDVLH